jgi:hypothetical protein
MAHDSGLTVALAPQVEVVHVHGGSSRLNVDIKAMTKIEVIISKHVYARNHTTGLTLWLTHTLIMALRLPMLFVGALVDLLTLHRVPALRVRSRMLLGLLQYYTGAMRTGSWLSPRAQANQTASD